MPQNNSEYVTVPTFSYPNIIPIVKMEQPDAGAIVTGGTMGALLWVYLDVSVWIGGPITGLGFLLGLLYVISAPSYLNAWQWTKTLYKYVRKPDYYASTEAAAEELNESVTSTTEQTQELTRIKRYYPSRDIIEREDGSFVAIIEVNPPHRDFATTDDWFSTAQSIAEWYNNAVDFEFQLYATTQPFPIEGHLEDLATRLDDSDVLGNPNLRALIEERLAAKQDSYQEAGTEVGHFYLILSIEEAEAAKISETDQSSIERLQSFPVLGMFFEGVEYYASGQADKTDTETRHEMARKLRNRITTVMGLGERLGDAEFERLPVTEMAALQRQFWRPSEKRASTSTMQPRQLPASTMEQPQEVET